MNVAVKGDWQTVYEQMADEAVLRAVRLGDSAAQDYIIQKYKGLVIMKVRTYFLVGSDRDDIIQEGMIGLFKAIRDYDPDKKSPFYPFAELCITRQIYTAIKTATRQKHKPLNTYVSLNKPVFEQESFSTYIESLPTAKNLNPEAVLIEREDRNYFEAKMNENLSALETKVLSLYLQGKSYFEIADMTKKPVKSVDNALQRIKKKIEKFINDKA